MIIEVIFDLETKKFFDEIGSNDPSQLGVSVVSLYKRTLNNNLQEEEGEIMSFWENDFEKMWPHFLEANRIIGFNSKRFDVPALKPYAPNIFPKLPHFDILEEVKKISGKRASLDKIAKLTVGKAKTDNPANATIYFQKGDNESLAKLKKYCEGDVLLTKEIYDFGLKNKFLKFKDFWNEERTITVDFSYPTVKAKPFAQNSLF
ncbi:hypothetical protein A3D00_01440 [Candidatus Woesebacteria bacterium RIFCSPHIGHO2_02_FULL_38_9]|uniref:YprB ribonuclease H-like domain-containing protein n=1 Tax=Candidatus Woesebacteria bacterium RIFCSPHIGHO2_01_FULL_39_28 TaxID=1802496 RepID=A0A1F7YH87_9BACT|nr:MAG: hypothetical protein A2627_04055 [Candidatus Woesebacteria bacterium RIFCSPHIGHO2_01_FULL_39_28]OGM34697.1 MAG: hypothetical protein A3D00_01440 [Candidatus Woesebacteria bacterium RIFCSPHIGHO2_02_FULL_38_9]OGM58669.1 MAG: hypothetical protein A3A50_02710 [Candidatus Woesebacteria bacterium RIFCSPLOWO2_01_FULL_38_20]